MPLTVASAERPALLDGSPLASPDAFPRDRVELSDRCREAALAALESGRWSMFTSPEVERCEAELAAAVGAEHAVLVNSCTTAIYAALAALDIGPGCRVGVPAFTYIGTCLPVIAAGAVPVLLDIDVRTCSIDPQRLEDAVRRRRLDAVVQAHLFGSAEGAEEVAGICARGGIAYVADCAQLVGDRPTTERLTRYGPCCFSFGESKLLRVGEGGCVVTDSGRIAERVRLVRHEGEVWLAHGRSRLGGRSPSPLEVVRELASVRVGLNLRPAAVTAALARIKLEELGGLLARTRANAETLAAALAEAPVPVRIPGPRPIWWTFPVVSARPGDRDVLLAALLAEGLPVGVHFPRLMSEHPAIQEAAANPGDPFPAAREFADRHLVLPIYPALSAPHMELLAAGVRKLSALPAGSAEARRAAGALLRDRRLSELCSGLFMFLEPARDPPPPAAS